MIKFDKNIWFFSYIILLLGIFYLSIFYKIPFIRSLLGLIILCILPGYLICVLFEIKKVTDIYENFLYSIGISIVFDLLFGLLMNSLLPLFGLNPLSFQNIQSAFFVIVLVLLALILYLQKVPEISFNFPKFLKIEKILLSITFAMLSCILIGIYLINYNITNLFLIFSFFLIPMLLIFLIIFYNNSIKHIYPFIILLISFSLLMTLELRSNYIIGIDMHEEYYFFISTLSHALWIPDPLYLLSASISISILPTIFEIFLDIDPQLLFKILYPLLFSIVPLIIYVIARNYLDELLAVFASCYYMFQALFISSQDTSRTPIGIFFFALAILILCNNELQNWKKYMLFMLFIAGTILSHYTSALIFLGIISLAYFIDIILSKYENTKENHFLNLSLIFYFISLVFFWFQQINSYVFEAATQGLLFRFTIFSELIDQDASKYVYPALRYSSFLWHYIRFTQALIFVVMGIGILFIFYHFLQKKNQENSFPKFIVNINRELFFIGIVAFGILFFIVFAPSLFFEYDTGRTKELIDVVLSIFLVLGAYNFFIFILWQEDLYFSNLKFHKKILPQINYLKSHKIQIISGILLFLLLPTYVFATGISYQYDGVPFKININSPKLSTSIEFGYNYIFDQDARTIQWFKNYSFKNAQIFSDKSGNKKITSLINRDLTLYQKSITKMPQQRILEGYIFLTVLNEYFGIFREPEWENTKVNQYEFILNQKNKIFSNGASLYK